MSATVNINTADVDFTCNVRTLLADAFTVLCTLRLTGTCRCITAGTSAVTYLRSSFVVAQIFCSSKRIASIVAAELTEHRGSCSTLQLHWTCASSLEERDL